MGDYTSMHAYLSRNTRIGSGILPGRQAISRGFRWLGPGSPDPVAGPETGFSHVWLPVAVLRRWACDGVSLCGCHCASGREGRLTRLRRCTARADKRKLMAQSLRAVEPPQCLLYAYGGAANGDPSRYATYWPFWPCPAYVTVTAFGFLLLSSAVIVTSPL